MNTEEQFQEKKIILERRMKYLLRKINNPKVDDIHKKAASKEYLYLYMYLIEKANFYEPFDDAHKCFH